MLQSPKLMTVKYEMAVKLMFFAKIAPEQRIKQIEEHIEQLILFKQELEEIEPWADDAGDSYQRLILDWGENLYDFLIQWFSQLLNELQKYDGDLPQKPKDGQQL